MQVSKASCDESLLFRAPGERVRGLHDQPTPQSKHSEPSLIRRTSRMIVFSTTVRGAVLFEVARRRRLRPSVCTVHEEYPGGRRRGAACLLR